MHESTKKKLTEETQSLSELVSLQSKRNNAANQKIFELTDQVNKQQETIRNLRARINQVHYVPAKDDPVDQALANYLNSRDKPLDVPFERESPHLQLRLQARIRQARTRQRDYSCGWWLHDD